MHEKRIELDSKTIDIRREQVRIIRESLKDGIRSRLTDQSLEVAIDQGDDFARQLTFDPKTG